MFGITLSGEYIAFILLAVCTIAGAVMMLSLTKVVHMVTSLAFTFISLAGIFVLLHAEFIAFVQILIYAGAVSILMLFGIMMTRHQARDEGTGNPWHHGLLLVGCAGLFGILYYVFNQTVFPPHEAVMAEDNTRAIGEQLYTLHVIPFELVSVLLTVAFIGAIVIAKREEEQ
ncbi:NADH-quinone oxidoreductase subunit J [Marinicrinis sediminis]|uniref:NADH-quinone oxidoreductase subunit J n=1 Tax=Marinicrinis sediminis TaxID=1652465 RepID=A0ABW5RAT5_9BACL